MSSEVFYKLARFATLTLLSAICVLSLIPNIDQDVIVNSDKLNHFLAYGALSGAMTLWLGPKRWVTIFLSCVALGLVLEGLQAIPFIGRTASVYDALANTGGTLIGYIFGVAVNRQVTLFLDRTIS